jgi:uncharacterized membrane protein
MNSYQKSVGKIIFILVIFICIFPSIFGIGHYYGRLAERKENTSYNVLALTDTYAFLESNDLEKVKSRLRFMIFENVMTYDQQFGQSINTNSFITHIWNYAHEIAREEQTNVVPISEKTLTDELNNFMKTNRVAKTNSTTSR